MAIGLAFVLGVWMLAALAAKARVGIALAAFAMARGVVVVLGMTQATPLPGGAHWIVQLLHLAVAIVAMAPANRLAEQVRERHGPPVPPPRAAADDPLPAT